MYCSFSKLNSTKVFCTNRIRGRCTQSLFSSISSSPGLRVSLSLYSHQVLSHVISLHGLTHRLICALRIYSSGRACHHFIWSLRNVMIPPLVLPLLIGRHNMIPPRVLPLLIGRHNMIPPRVLPPRIVRHRPIIRVSSLPVYGRDYPHPRSCNYPSPFFRSGRSTCLLLHRDTIYRIIYLALWLPIFSTDPDQPIGWYPRPHAESCIWSEVYRTYTPI